MTLNSTIAMHHKSIRISSSTTWTNERMKLRGKKSTFHLVRHARRGIWACRTGCLHLHDARIPYSPLLLSHSFINYWENSLRCCGKRFTAWERSRSLRMNAAWLRSKRMENQWLDSHSAQYNQAHTTHTHIHSAIVAHAMENKFRREYLRLIITCGLTAQYSRLNTNEFNVINGKRKKKWLARTSAKKEENQNQKKKSNTNNNTTHNNSRKLRPIFHQSEHAKIISTV